MSVRREETQPLGMPLSQGGVISCLDLLCLQSLFLPLKENASKKKNIQIFFKLKHCIINRMDFFKRRWGGVGVGIC